VLYSAADVITGPDLYANALDQSLYFKGLWSELVCLIWVIKGCLIAKV